jgi:Inorganic pyrophosphatase
MDLSKISAGDKAPDEVNVVIEIPKGGQPVKYEIDKDSGAVMVDRFMTAAMFYPADYGFVPNTLAADNDPIDVLVVTRASVVPGCIIRCRPIGVLHMEDDGGGDDKIVAVPVTKLDPYYADINSCDDLPEIFRDQIKHFFERYKDLEKGKWVKVGGWSGPEEAKRLIQESIDNA